MMTLDQIINKRQVIQDYMSGKSKCDDPRAMVLFHTVKLYEELLQFIQLRLKTSDYIDEELINEALKPINIGDQI